MNTGMLQPPTITNPCSNPTRQRLTLLMWRSPLSLRQTSHHLEGKLIYFSHAPVQSNFAKRLSNAAHNAHLYY